MGGPIFWEKRPTCPESPKLGKKTPLYAFDETLTDSHMQSSTHYGYHAINTLEGLSAESSTQKRELSI